MPLQKDWIFFKKKKKILMSSESIVKYLFWDCYVLFWPSHHQPILTPSNAYYWLEMSPYPTSTLFKFRKHTFILSDESHIAKKKIGLFFPFSKKSRVWYLWRSWRRGPGLLLNDCVERSVCCSVRMCFHGPRPKPAFTSLPKSTLTTIRVGNTVG